MTKSSKNLRKFSKSSEIFGNLRNASKPFYDFWKISENIRKCSEIYRVLCTVTKRTNKRNKEQEHITKKLASFTTLCCFLLWLFNKATILYLLDFYCRYCSISQSESHFKQLVVDPSQPASLYQLCCHVDPKDWNFTLVTQSWVPSRHNTPHGSNSYCSTVVYLRYKKQALKLPTVLPVRKMVHRVLYPRNTNLWHKLQIFSKIFQVPAVRRSLCEEGTGISRRSKLLVNECKWHRITIHWTLSIGLIYTEGKVLTFFGYCTAKLARHTSLVYIVKHTQLRK